MSGYFTRNHVGFTGTRNGMTVDQALTVARLLSPYEWVHHGDCVGADEETHQLARAANIKVDIHPPTNHHLRAYCEGDIVRPVKPYILRNHDIVDSTCALIAAPAGLTEQPRGGTWATARYARAVGAPVSIVLPNGAVVTWGMEITA